MRGRALYFARPEFRPAMEGHRPTYPQARRCIFS
jgi:hypothetical protein